MIIQHTISGQVKTAVNTLYQADLESVELQDTRKDFEGDITVVVFPMLRVVKGNPVAIGEAIGVYLVAHVEEIISFNVVKGFLNLVISDEYYLDFFAKIKGIKHYGFVVPTTEKKSVMVEYSSPNTNKPLHLGHVRNNLLGYAVAEIIKASGKKVYKTQVINDRGIHICKSMLAWQKFGNGETPEVTGLKGDKLVGNYYVRFEQEFQKEYSIWLDQNTTSELYKKAEGIVKLEEVQMFLSEELIAYSNKGYDLSNEKIRKEIEDEIVRKFFKSTLKNHFFTNISVLGAQAQEMLRKWEAGDKEVVTLWKTMNSWVYKGFEETYKTLGVDFDSYYYESDTYLLGKDSIEEGLTKGVFYTKEDGSVWCDLSDEKLDDKLVLRSDGTAVYITQDIGTAIQRVKDNPDVGGLIYTVGNEQDHHFKVLFAILKKLGYDWSSNLHHLSYGMVDLPSGKMKSREGTVVDADDLMVEMASTAGEISKELGKLDDYSEIEKNEIYNTIGLGALKYFLLKVDPKKRILFDPKESVDFQGNTGPFIQYTYARIQAILRKADFDYHASITTIPLDIKEKELIKVLEAYPEIIQQAAKDLSPAIIANYTYDLVKSYNSFFQNVSIFGADTEEEKTFRIQLSGVVGATIKSAFGLLGIQVPKRM